MTTTKHQKICEGYEPIAGYVLEEAIGRGGFGEVWRCTAPGGLKKAIKFVFGNQDQSRALREQRSLERVKGVHHPFLLTLERFEIVDEQLVIITELADGSLEDVFVRHRENGSCGIPRDVLLSHLHDTADGLDYLHQSFHLQHLDIKPGNLLIIGGHVKVADFGLLKDLRDIDCSVVGGLTPIYAPPEVFDGRPSLHSDQYSLAVMFQELLTGTRPFSGRTIAQLATQHVHSAPNLESLPPSDRPVVARALEKNPNRRFLSCSAFVDALRKQRTRHSQAARNEPNKVDSDDTQDGINSAGSAVADLPQLANDASVKSGQADHHALMIALGGSGAECVREMRRRIADMHIESPLHLHSVVIDTDLSTIHAMRLGEVSDRVPKCNVIYTPLKTANEYRSAGTDRLKSISRRWIYNVPRSGSTEGMRPLGRLALVDHGTLVQQKLADSIRELVAQSGGVAPRVYVVGSLAGGTGSGMYVDVVHLLRHLLDQAGLEETRITSLMSCVGFQVDQSNPLALHDAQAALNEIEFFMQVGNGYPGDEGAGWPSVPAARTPLRDLYLIAAAPAGRLAPNPIETMIEYAWADATGSGDLLSAARRIEEDESHQAIRPPSIRSVGVVPLGDRNRLETRVLAPALVRELLTRWLGIPSKSRQAAPALADRLERRLSLTLAQTIESISDHLDHDALPISTVGSFDSMIAQRIANGEMGWVSASWQNNLHREISVCLNDRRADISTILETLKILHQRCLQWSLESIQSAPLPCGTSNEEAERATVLDAYVKRMASSQLDKFAEAMKFLEERMERLAAILAVGIFESKTEMGDINPWQTLPGPVRDKYEGLVIQLHSAAVGQSLVRPLNDLGANVDVRSLIAELTHTAVPMVIDVVQQHSQDFAAANGRSVDNLETVTATGSQADIGMHHSRVDGTQEFTMVRQVRMRSEVVSVDDAVDAVKPPLLALGGLQRLILIVSNEVERSQLEPELRAIHAGSLTVAVIPGSDPKLVHEAQQIEMKNIMSRLTSLNGGNAQVTTRLAGRVDVTF